MADLRDRFMLRPEAALVSGKLTRGGTGGQLGFPEVIMARCFIEQKGEVRRWQMEMALGGGHNSCNS
jgi:hypothetical protein